MIKVHIVFKQGCIDYISSVESVNYFPSMGKITLILNGDYTEEQHRYEDSTDDPLRVYNISTLPFKHSFLIDEMQKMCIEE